MGVPGDVRRELESSGGPWRWRLRDLGGMLVCISVGAEGAEKYCELMEGQNSSEQQNEQRLKQDRKEEADTVCLEITRSASSTYDYTCLHLI